MMKKFFCKIGDFLHAIGSMSLEKKYDLSLSLYSDDETETPECTHRLQGTSRHNLMKLVGVICAVVVPFMVLGAIFSRR